VRYNELVILTQACKLQ